MKSVLGLLFLSWSVCWTTGALTPKEFAQKAGDAFLKRPDDFLQWFYGGGVVVEGLFRADRYLGLDYSKALDSLLDHYKRDPDAYGFMMLHEKNIPWFHNVGDEVPLFSMNYLNRVVNSSRGPTVSDNDMIEDLNIAYQGAMRYVLDFPVHLPDGTFSRDYGWHTEPNGTRSFLWCDDMYMGLTPLARILTHPLYKREDLMLQAARWAVTFSRHLRDPEDDLYWHGANAASGHHSCCKWGRANGWALMAKAEVLEAMEQYTTLVTRSEYMALRGEYVRHAKAVVRAQAADGRWHQVLNESSLFLETSCSAMFVSSLARGLVNGWMDEPGVRDAVDRGWQGLLKVISDDGTLAGVCDGEGVKTEPEQYAHCSTDYAKSADGGAGAVLYAAADYQRYRERAARAGRAAGGRL